MLLLVLDLQRNLVFGLCENRHIQRVINTLRIGVSKQPPKLSIVWEKQRTSMTRQYTMLSVWIATFAPSHRSKDWTGSNAVGFTDSTLMSSFASSSLVRHLARILFSLDAAGWTNHYPQNVQGLHQHERYHQTGAEVLDFDPNWYPRCLI